MTKVLKVLKGAVFMVLSTLPALGLAQVEYDYAPVVEVRPVVQIVEVSSPREQCWEEEYLVDRQYRRNDSRTPEIVGAIIGGAVGNAAGTNKSSQRVGAVAGAVLGHSVARDIINNSQGETVREIETVQRCETVLQSFEEERVVGYDVTYTYNGREYTIRTDSDPGNEIQVRVSVEPVL